MLNGVLKIRTTTHVSFKGRQYKRVFSYSTLARVSCLYGGYNSAKCMQRCRAADHFIIEILAWHCQPRDWTATFASCGGPVSLSGPRQHCPRAFTNKSVPRRILRLARMRWTSPFQLLLTNLSQSQAKPKPMPKPKPWAEVVYIITLCPSRPRPVPVPQISS